MKRIAGCVILYNPCIDSAKYIESYAPYLDALYIVNNGGGEDVIEGVKKKYNNIVVRKYDNMGIAKPLNDILADCNDKYELLLTMDQDSFFPEGMFLIYKEALESICWENTLGVGPKIIEYDTVVPKENLNIQETTQLITSGNVINLNKAVKIGGYDENLFIDEVDFEFCYRGMKNNLKLYSYNTGIYLKHCLGNRLEKKVLFKKRNSLNHGAIRKYYMFRNRLYIYDRYKDINPKFFFKQCIRRNMRDIRKIILVENNKWEKLKACWLGYCDYRAGIMGKKAILE